MGAIFSAFFKPKMKEIRPVLRETWLFKVWQPETASVSRNWPDSGKNTCQKSPKIINFGAELNEPLCSEEDNFKQPQLSQYWSDFLHFWLKKMAKSQPHCSHDKLESAVALEMVSISC